MLSAVWSPRKKTQKMIQIVLLTTLCLFNLSVWGETEKNSVEKNSPKNGSKVNKNVNTEPKKIISETQKNQKESHVSVQLSTIVAEKTTENSGDEIYINITSYSNLGYSKESRVPNYPKNWISKNLDQIKDLNLWEGAVKEGEEVKIILTVAEQDSPPWDIDDLIGSAQLTLTRKNGQLIKEWGLPIFEEKAEAVQGNQDPDTANQNAVNQNIANQSTEKNNKMISQKYLFTGDNSRYNVIFKLEEK